MATKKKALIVGASNLDPDAQFPVPPDKSFEEIGDEFIPADNIGEIGQALIDKHLCFESIREAKIIYLWKRKGSETPKMLLGKCQRPSGLLKHFSSADFIVFLCANNCRGLTRWQIEALTFHELKHAKIDDEKPVTVPHDWEGFAEEIQRYGLWKRDIEPIAQAVTKSLNLPFEPAPPLPAKAANEAVQ